MSDVSIIGSGNMASATVGTWGAAPGGDIVILAGLFESAVEVAGQFGDALDGKTIVDIANPFNADATGLAIPHDTGGSLDVFMAGDDADSKASVATFIDSLGPRPRDAGDLGMAHWLEGAGLLSMGLAHNGVGNFDFSLGVNAG